MCFRTLLPLLGLILLGPTVSNAQIRHRALSSEALRHIGLEKMWQAQVAVDSGAGSVVAVTLDLDEENAYTVFEVEHDLGPTIFTDRQLDAFGQPLGVEGAAREAQELKARLEQRGEQASIKEFTVPEISLYSQTSAGVLHAIDAETGRTRWAMPAGFRKYPSLAAAVHRQHVAVVNGATLFVMDVDNGKLLWEKSLFAAVGAPPAMGDHHVFVPLSNGMLEAFDLENTLKAPERSAAAGYATGRPTITPRSVSWGTSRGFLYVRDHNSPKMRFRLDTSDAIVGSPIFYAAENLIVVSRDGYVHSVHEIHGTKNWRFSTGELVSEAAVLVGDELYIITDLGGMYRISAKTGLEQWRTDHIRKFVSSTGERLYCLGDAHQLVVLDANTGNRIAAVPLPPMDRVVTQGLTDRLYLGTSSGQIVCLREPRNRWPVRHQRLTKALADQSKESATDAGIFGPDPAEQKPADSEKAVPAAAPRLPDPAEAIDEDPFGDDPFK